MAYFCTSAHLKVTYHLQPATRVHRSKMCTSSRTHNSTPGTLPYPQTARLDSGPVSLYVSDLPDHLFAAFLLTSAHHHLPVAYLDQSHLNERLLLTNHAFTRYRLCLLCRHNRRDRLALFVGISNVYYSKCGGPVAHTGEQCSVELQQLRDRTEWGLLFCECRPPYHR